MNSEKIKRAVLYLSGIGGTWSDLSVRCRIDATLKHFAVQVMKHTTDASNAEIAEAIGFKSRLCQLDTNRCSRVARGPQGLAFVDEVIELLKHDDDIPTLHHSAREKRIARNVFEARIESFEPLPSIERFAKQGLHKLDVLACLPKLPHMAESEDIAHDLNTKPWYVDQKVMALREDGFRIQSMPGSRGLRYGLSVISWDKAQRGAAEHVRLKSMAESADTKVTHTPGNPAERV